MTLRSLFLIATLLGAILADPPPDKGFTPLIAGDDPGSAFTYVGIERDSVVFKEREIALTGTPRGYLATKVSHGDFILRVSWRFDLPAGADSANADANSGILLRIAGPPKVWPTALEMQITPEDPGGLFALGSKFEGEVNVLAQRRAARPAGEWNESEVEVTGKTVVSRLNGVEIARGTFDGPPGPIGFQSQGTPVCFREPRIRVVPGGPASR